MDIPDKLYTSTEVARLLGVSLRSVYRYLESGKLKSTQIPTGRHRFSKQDIEDFLNPGNQSEKENNESLKNKIKDAPRVKAGARGAPSVDREKVSAPEERFVTESANDKGPVFRYFSSPVNDLKTLAKTIKKSSELASIPYAFTLYAGLSLHHPIRPFTILHLYVNKSDLEFFKKRLLLSESDKSGANICLIETQSQSVFDASYEKGGFMIVSDERLYEDLVHEGEEELARGLKETIGL